MRTTILSSTFLVTILVGCTGSDRYGGVPGWDTDTPRDTDSDTDDDTDPDTDDDTDPDTDDDTDPDTDDDTDITADPDACHAFDPMEQVGLRRDYAIEYNGAEGTETQIVEGEALNGKGETVFAVSTVVTAGTEGWKGKTYHVCDERNNLYMVGWNVTLNVTMAGLPMPLEVGPVEGYHGPRRKYLPSVQDMGSIGSWNGDYDIQVINEGETSTIVTKGEYTEFGFGKTTVPAGTFDVYIVSSRYTQDRSGVGGFSLPKELKDFFPDIDVFGALGSFGEDVDAIAEYHYAEGVGLVFEETGDPTTGDLFMYKELKSYTPGR